MVLLVQRYCSQFEFESLFIGSLGCNVKEIKQECNNDVIIRVKPLKDQFEVKIIGFNSVENFLKAVRLSQAKLVSIMLKFMRLQRNRSLKEKDGFRCCRA